MKEPLFTDTTSTNGHSDEFALANDPVLIDRRRWREIGWPNESAMAAFMSVLRLEQDVVSTVHEILSEFGISITEHAALIHLALSPSNREVLGRIADRLMIGPGRCNYVINSLEGKGLIRRKAHPSDGRVTFATLTAKGKRTVTAACVSLSEHNFGFGDLTEEELDDLVDSLTRARKASVRGVSPNERAATATGSHIRREK